MNIKRRATIVAAATAGVTAALSLGAPTSQAGSATCAWSGGKIGNMTGEVGSVCIETPLSPITDKVWELIDDATKPINP